MSYEGFSDDQNSAQLPEETRLPPSLRRAFFVSKFWCWVLSLSLFVVLPLYVVQSVVIVYAITNTAEGALSSMATMIVPMLLQLAFWGIFFGGPAVVLCCYTFRLKTLLAADRVDYLPEVFRMQHRVWIACGTSMAIVMLLVALAVLWRMWLIGW